jgi:hypothetical protein
MAPVADEMVNPGGRVGDIVYVSGGVPPDPVTGVNVVVDWFCVNVVDAIACVTTGPTAVNAVAVVAVVPVTDAGPEADTTPVV